MTFTHNLRTRIDTMPPSFFFLLRIALGIMLFIKGVEFISHIQQLESIIAASRFQEGTVFLTHYITYAHLLGGFFIIIGLFTRFFCIIQLPILFGAVFFFALPHTAFNVQIGELGFSIVVLVLLIFFSIKGSGSYSIGRYVQEHRV